MRNPPRDQVNTAQNFLADQSFGRRWGTGTGSEDTVEGNWVPMTDGAEPPGFITDGAGNLIFVWYTP